MNWINVKESLPEHNQSVLVIVDGNIGVATYDKHFGFGADSSAYEIYVLDDSGLEVSLCKIPSHWMKIPELPKLEASK